MSADNPNMVERAKYLSRWNALKQERSTWFAHWSDITKHLLPRNGRYFVSDRNRGQPRHNAIYDRTATGALKTLSAGMMAGMTSPARPWLQFATRDRALMKSQAVRLWCDEVTKLVLTVFAKGNTYRALHEVYKELGAFGTAGTVVLDDFSDVMRQYTLTAGEYCIAQDWRGETCTLYREFDKTVSEVVKEFGRENCSPNTVRMFDTGHLDAWVRIVHAIEPRADRDPSKRDAKNMAFSSIYFESGSDARYILRESGYRDFPALAPRWDVAGGDVYGNGPGMEALGDVKQLQHQQLRKSQAIDYMTNPPLQMPTGMKGREISALPGGVTYFDTQQAPGARNLFQVQLDLNHMLADIQDVRGRINNAFYADLFLMLANSTNSQMTATEVAERHEEKMLMLGPVLERMNDELLNPLVQGAFHRALAAGLVPPAPPEMQRQEIEVEYVSMLAQAQRAIGSNSIDRFVGNLGAVAQFKPDVLDKFDADAWADAYSDMLGVDPNLIVGNDKVAIVRKQRQQAQVEAQQAAVNNQRADTAQKLGNTPTQGGSSSALNDIMGGLTGYGSPSPSAVGIAAGDTARGA